MKLLRRKKFVLPAIVGIAALVGAGVAYGYFTTHGSGTGSATAGTPSSLLIDQLGGTPMYNSTIDPSTYISSQAFYATGAGELGNKINLANGGGPLSDVVVAMANFNPVSAPMDITLNIYNPGSYSALGSAPGSLIATDKQTFTIPAAPNGGYGSAACAPSVAANPDSTCGIGNFNITFNFSSQDITLPSTVVYGIQYNDPQGAVTGGVNVQLVNETTQVTVGSDADPGYLFTSLASTANGDGWTVSGSNDVGPGEITCQTVTSTFGEYSTASTSSGCGYGTPAFVPAVEFDMSAMSDLYPGGPPQPINFSVTNPGSIPVPLTTVTVGIATDANGLVEATPGYPSTDDAGCYASWFTINQAPDINGSVAAGQTWVDSPSGDSIVMPSSLSDQDACEGATIGLTFAAS